jgi:hypothetical protein
LSIDAYPKFNAFLCRDLAIACCHISVAHRRASKTLVTSTNKPSPVVLTMRSILRDRRVDHFGAYGL